MFDSIIGWAKKSAKGGGIVAFIASSMRSMYRKWSLDRLRFSAWWLQPQDSKQIGAMPSLPQERLEPPICDDLKTWCAQTAGANYHFVKSAQVVQRRRPYTVDSELLNGFTPYFNTQTPEKAVVRIPNARLVGNSGLIVLPDGRFVGETINNSPKGRRDLLLNQPAYYSPLPSRLVKKPGDYFSLMVITWTNYYHWSHDVIMKLWAIKDYLPTNVQFIAPSSLKPFQYETLRFLDIDQSQILNFCEDEVWELESLYLTIPYPKPALHTLEPFEWFRARSFEIYGVNKSAAPTKRIYLSRSLDGYFQTVNEAEVIDCLTEYGFEVCWPSTMPLQDQVALFSEASVIVGTGSGLFNMVYAPPGARIVQFQMPKRFIAALWTMSESLGHEYWYVTSHAIQNPKSAQYEPNILVPIDSLRKTLDHIFSTK